MDRVQEKLNFEAHVWLLSEIYSNCKTRATKNVNWSNPASGNATDEELKNFSSSFISPPSADGLDEMAAWTWGHNHVGSVLEYFLDLLHI